MKHSNSSHDAGRGTAFGNAEPFPSAAELAADDRFLTELAAGAMGGSTEPIAFVRVASIGGLNPKVNESLSTGFCSMLNKELGIDTGRIYLNFEVFSGSNWGFNGSTF